MTLLKKKLFTLLISVCLFVVAISTYGSLAWFASNNKVDATDMTVTVQDMVSVIIKKTANGEDIGVSNITNDMTRIDNVIDEEDETTIQPGSTGSFTFYLEYDSTSHLDSYTFQLSLSVVNNQFRPFEGFFENKEEKEEDKIESLRYINSHIMFFDSKEDDVYSNWIKVNEVFECPFNETESEYVYQRTIYWVWVMDYGDIFNGEATFIDNDDLTAIAAYYSVEENKSLMFADGIKGEDEYNVADYMIGTTIQYICFEIEVS